MHWPIPLHPELAGQSALLMHGWVQCMPFALKLKQSMLAQSAFVVHGAPNGAPIPLDELVAPPAPPADDDVIIAPVDEAAPPADDDDVIDPVDDAPPADDDDVFVPLDVMLDVSADDAVAPPLPLLVLELEHPNAATPIIPKQALSIP